ncbi:MAG: fibronectin type III domain-containing protein [Candidatus Magasanikbacteria bacterium]|nr:fibronectin type III domain-containing protein [Candidatus Magasanikbacteria bacterium]
MIKEGIVRRWDGSQNHEIVSKKDRKKKLRNLAKKYAVRPNQEVLGVRTSVLVHYLKSIVFFPLFILHFFTPNFFKGNVNLWTNLKEIFISKKFHPLRVAFVSWVFFLVVMIQATIYFVDKAPPIWAATYDFVQTEWTAASTTATGVHPTNKTGWTLYDSASSSISTGTELTLSLADTNNTQTSNADFDGGTHSSTTASNDTLNLGTDISFTDLSDRSSNTYFPVSGPYDIFVSGTLAYLADGSGDFRILDVTDPYNPNILKSITLTNKGYGVELVGTLAYVAAGTDGLVIIDVANYATASIIGSVATVGAQDVFVSGTIAYVADSTGGLRIIDISNPTTPNIIGTYLDSGIAYSVTVSGTVAYLADYYNIRTIDVSSSTNPTVLDSLAMTRAYDVVVSNTIAYVADYTNGLKIVDIASSTNINLSTTFDVVEGSSYSLDLVGTNVYLAEDSGTDGGVIIIDVSSSTNPIVIARNMSFYSIRYLNVFNDIVYLGSTSYGTLSILDVSSFTSLSKTGSVNFEDNYSGELFVSGDLAYVVQSTFNKMKIVDISNPNSPVVLGTTATMGDSTNNVFVSGSIAYVAARSSGLKIVDVSSSTAPVILGTYNTTNYAYDIFVSGTIAYVADFSAGLHLIDVSSSTAPTLLATQDTPGLAYAVVVSGTIAYVADDNTGGLQIIDVSSSTAPSIVGSYTACGSNVYDLSVIGNYAYLACGVNGLYVVDVSSSTAPTLSDSINIGVVVRNISVSGDYAYLSSSKEFAVINISDPANITHASNRSYNTLSDVFVLDNYLYVYNSKNSTSYLDIIKVQNYKTSGTFTSSIIDTTANVSFGALSWNGALPSNTTLTVKARTSDDSGMSGAGEWGTCTSLSSGTDITDDATCVSDTNRYVQYQAILTSSDVDATPTIEDITIVHQSYPLTNQSLISSAYDTGSSANVMGDMSWIETKPTGSNVRFQLRTAPDSSGSPGTWTSWLGPTSDADYYSTPAGGHTINSTNTDGVNDQWVQYKAILTSDGINVPILSDLNMTYVVNDAPNFESTITAVQATSTGYINIAYSVRDTDTASSGVNCAECVTPSFHYSTDSGNNWTPITTGLSANATSTKTVTTTNYTTYTPTWNSKAQIDGTYSTTFAIRVTINDGEGANNTALSSSTVFTVDVKDPTPGIIPIYVEATSTPALVTLSGSDDSAGLQMCVTIQSDYSDCSSYTDYNTTSSLSFVTDPDTGYVRFKDAYQNTYSASASTAETPELIILRDLSNVSTDEYQHFFAWRTVSEPFNRYQVWQSTNGTDFSILTEVTTRTTNYYFNRSLVSSSEYYYKANTVDDDGNASFFSSVLSDQPNGQGGSDATSPTITNVTTSTLSTQSVVIVWDTDELSDSTITYSTTPATFTTSVGVSTMVDSVSASGDQHSVAITGLTPNTTYYYQAKSVDPSGNIGTEVNGGDGYSFTTVDGPSISAVTTKTVLNTNATITWNTDQSSNTSIFYSTNSDLSEATELTVSESVTEHTANVTGLVAATTYYYYVVSGVAVDNNGGSYYSFTTSNDTVAPVLTAITAIGVTDDDAVITWTSNEGATSQVQYGVATGVYDTITIENSNLNTNHAVTLTGLTVDTPYFYIVVSTDGSGNTSTSTEYTFTTLELLSEESAVEIREAAAEATGQANASSGGMIIIQGGDSIPPSIFNINVKDITMDSAVMTWESDEVGDSIVEFGLSDSYGSIAGSVANVTNHEVTILHLSAGTTYHYRVTTLDAGGNRTNSEDFTFETKTFLSEEDLAEIDDEGTSESSFANLLQRTRELIAKMATQVSVAALEREVNTQYKSLRELARLIPSPLIGGQPVVDAGATSARISWTTDKNSNSLVAFAQSNIFGNTGKYSQVVGNSDADVTEHTVVVNELSPGTSYNYQVQSKTPVSPLSKSPNFIFITRQEEVEITNYRIDSSAMDQANFYWVTSVIADSKVTYTPYRDGVLSFDEAVSKDDKAMTTIHEIEIRDFEGGIVYQIELSGKDVSGNIVSKVIPTYSTTDIDMAPIISQVQTDSAMLPGDDQRIQAVISWATNEPSTSQIYFQKGFSTSDTLKSKTALDPNYVKRHVLVLTNFEPGSVYQFQVESKDSTGNITKSRTFTILTPKQKESVFQVILKNIEETFSWVGELGI